MANLDKIHFYPRLNEHLFYFKLPYLFIDLGLAFLLASLFEKPEQRKAAFCFWLFNPLALYTSFMIGQLDLLPTFFTVLAVWLTTRGRRKLALLSLGIGGGYKMFPLLLIPPASFLLGRDFKQKLTLIGCGFLPFLISIAPFWNSRAFRAMVLFAPKTQKMLFMGWPVSGAEVVYPFVLFLVIIFWSSFFTKKEAPLPVWFLAVLLTVFSITHYHPQWFLWLTPFLIWELVENKFKNSLLVLVLLGCWLILTLLFEASLSFGLFSPLWPPLKKVASLSTLLARWLDVNQLKSLIRSLFAGTAIFYLLRLTIFF